MEQKKRLMFGLAAGTAVFVGGAIVVALALGVIPRPATHVVIQGDTLHKIAISNGVSVADLKEWNDIQNEDVIDVGQILVMWPRAAVLDRKNRRARTPVKTLKVTGALAGTTGGLAMPPVKKCLGGPTLSAVQGTDEMMVGSEGLNYEQISASMGGFVHNTLSCISGADSFPDDTLEMEITVACTGRVADIQVINQGDWSNDMSKCVMETLRFAPFPAHDLPDGEVFGYPLRFSR